MRKVLLWSAMTVALLGALLGPHNVWAQNNPPADAQPQTPSPAAAPDYTVPPNAQPQSPLADQAAPAAVGPAQANTASTIEHKGPPGATPQTIPSTISAENAALDKLPTTALQLPLNDEQRRLIAKSLAAAPQTQTKADLTNVHVAGFLPTGVPIQGFSSELTKQYPPMGQYKYVKLNNRVLIVDPPNLTVVGEIPL